MRWHALMWPSCEQRRGPWCDLRDEPSSVRHRAALVHVLVWAAEHEQALHLRDESLHGGPHVRLGVDRVVRLERRLDHAGLQRVRNLQGHRIHLLARQVARGHERVGRRLDLRGERLCDVPEVVVVRIVVPVRGVHEELDHVLDHRRLGRGRRRRRRAPPVHRLHEVLHREVVRVVELVGDGRGERAHEALEDGRGEPVVPRTLVGHARVGRLEALHQVPRVVALEGDRLRVGDDLGEPLRRARAHVHDRAVEDGLLAPRLVDELHVARERLDPLEDPVVDVQPLVREHDLRLGEEVAVREVHADLVRRDQRGRGDALGEVPLGRAVGVVKLVLARDVQHLDGAHLDAELVGGEVELHGWRRVAVIGRLALRVFEQEREVAHDHVGHLLGDDGAHRAAAQPRRGGVPLHLLGVRAHVALHRGVEVLQLLGRCLANELGAKARVEDVVEELVGERLPHHPVGRGVERARAHDLVEGARVLLDGVRRHGGEDLVALELVDLLRHLRAEPPAMLVLRHADGGEVLAAQRLARLLHRVGDAVDGEVLPLGRRHDVAQPLERLVRARARDHVAQQLQVQHAEVKLLFFRLLVHGRLEARGKRVREVGDGVADEEEDDDGQRRAPKQGGDVPHHVDEVVREAERQRVAPLAERAEAGPREQIVLAHIRHQLVDERVDPHEDDHVPRVPVDALALAWQVDGHVVEQEPEAAEREHRDEVDERHLEHRRVRHRERAEQRARLARRPPQPARGEDRPRARHEHQQDRVREEHAAVEAEQLRGGHLLRARVACTQHVQARPPQHGHRDHGERDEVEEHEREPREDIGAGVCERGHAELVDPRLVEGCC
mmetsp:Transcript_24224/g.62451  ORF Transcript_24224/g.62451 Transcript_24224/m.62451 type:complete len:838 (-) Transcript_24224:2038-4551(-)